MPQLKRGLIAVGVMVVAVFVAPLVAGCGPDTDIKTSVTVDRGTHRATIEYHTGGAFDITALFLTYPDGHREMLAKGNIARGGARLSTAELSRGDYTYTVYWIPQEDQDPDSVSVDTIVESGQAVSGKFTVD